jgi:phenylalanyl-tRNA synthetase alpha subunit
VDLKELRKSIEKAFEDEKTVQKVVFAPNGLLDLAFIEAKAINPPLLQELSEIKAYYINLYDSKFNKKFDSTVPSAIQFGKIHPLSQSIADCRKILSSYGLTEVEYDCVDGIGWGGSGGGSSGGLASSLYFLLLVLNRLP